MAAADIAWAVQPDHSYLVDLRPYSGKNQRKGGVNQTQQFDSGPKRNQRPDY